MLGLASPPLDSGSYATSRQPAYRYPVQQCPSEEHPWHSSTGTLAAGPPSSRYHASNSETGVHPACYPGLSGTARSVREPQLPLRTTVRLPGWRCLPRRPSACTPPCTHRVPTVSCMYPSVLDISGIPRAIRHRQVTTCLTSLVAILSELPYPVLLLPCPTVHYPALLYTTLSWVHYPALLYYPAMGNLVYTTLPYYYPAHTTPGTPPYPGYSFLPWVLLPTLHACYPAPPVRPGCTYRHIPTGTLVVVPPSSQVFLSRETRVHSRESTAYTPLLGLASPGYATVALLRRQRPPPVTPR